MKKEKSPEKIDLQFEKIIKSIMDEQGYFKEKNVKILVSEILDQLEPIITKQIEKHFNEIGTFLLNINNNNIKSLPSEKEKNAKAS